MSSKKVPVVNESLCIGCGLCESIYPKIFKLGEDFKAEVIGECEDEKKCQEAIDSCPVDAISWESENGSEQLRKLSESEGRRIRESERRKFRFV